jgi:uncharacterized Zn-binding protein involved in type VI secretion
MSSEPRQGVVSLMKFKVALAGAAVVALALPVTAAVAGNGDKATGGGQVLLGSGDVKASTIAFTAQGTTEAAKGQVQFVDRSAGTGRNQVKYHGIVDCIEVTGTLAIIGGFKRGGEASDSADRFVLRVQDNGEPNRGADMIQFDNESDAPDTCGNDDENEPPEFALARGNAQVRDGDSANPQQRSMSFRKALRIAGLR